MSTATKTAPASPLTKEGSVTLEAAPALHLANVALSAISTDEVTPIITCGHLSRIDGDTVRVIATDLYRVHMSDLPVVSITDGFEALIPAKALKWIAANAAFFGRPGRVVGEPRVRLSWIPAQLGPNANARVAVSIFDAADSDQLVSLSYTDFAYVGNFPPVARLVLDARDAPEAPIAAARLNPDFLAKVAKLGPRGYAPRFKFTAGKENQNKPGPLLVTFDATHMPRTEALIQPNINL